MHVSRVVATAFLCVAVPAAAQNTRGWPVSTPADQHLDAAPLTALIERASLVRSATSIASSSFATATS